VDGARPAMGYNGEAGWARPEGRRRRERSEITPRGGVNRCKTNLLKIQCNLK